MDWLWYLCKWPNDRLGCLPRYDFREINDLYYKLGWFAGGVGNVRDCNVGSEHSLNIDTNNNYQLLASSETTVTTIEVVRLLNTGDTEDRVINPLATTNVIFSYRTSDSVGKSTLPKRVLYEFFDSLATY